MHRRKRRILKSLVLGLAIAAFAAPPALAQSPDDRPFYRGPSVQVQNRIVSPDDRSFYRGPAPVEKRIVSPDDRSFYRGPASVEKRIVSPDDRSFYRGETPTKVVTRIVSPDDRPFYRGVETPSVLPVSVTVSTDSDDFQWVDASLGAASTLAFVLLLGAGALAIRHQRRRIAAY
ncbi:MAG TPA: hypothetical protein VFL41_02210 [Gaiellaceae bacterium]|nr:hypothetical protein [Gaiellaceae bacterium]